MESRSDDASEHPRDEEEAAWLAAAPMAREVFAAVAGRSTPPVRQIKSDGTLRGLVCLRSTCALAAQAALWLAPLQA